MLAFCRSLIVVIALVAPASVAQERGRDVDRNSTQEDARQRAIERHEQSGSGVLALLPSDSVTEHNIDLPSGKLAYTATAGTFALFDQNGERSAQIFYTAFVAKGANATGRPVTFVFNGGPGAASAFLNLGLVGPRVAEFGPDGRDGSKVRLIDNPDTWLRPNSTCDHSKSQISEARKPQCADFITAKRMGRWFAALDPPDVKRGRSYAAIPRYRLRVRHGARRPVHAGCRQSADKAHW